MAHLVKKGTKGAKGKVKIDGPAAEPVVGIAEIDFGTKASKPGKKASKYPEIEGSIESLVDKIIDLTEKFDAVNDPLKAAKQDLIAIAFPQFFDKNNGKFEPASSMLGHGASGKGVRVTFKNQFTPGDRQRLQTFLGPERAAKFFQQQWSVKIDGEALAADPVKGGKFINEIRELAAAYGLREAVEIKSGILPVESFAKNRHREFTPRENATIQEIVPQWVSVSTKGVAPK
jgi:hypothetical protein